MRAIIDDETARTEIGYRPRILGDVRDQTLEQARARWDALDLRDCRIKMSVLCFCDQRDTGPFEVTVVNGQVANVKFAPDGPDGQPPAPTQATSVNILFDRIQEALDLDAFKVDATYDPQTGMPTRGSSTAAPT